MQLTHNNLTIDFNWEQGEYSRDIEQPSTMEGISNIQVYEDDNDTDINPSMSRTEQDYIEDVIRTGLRKMKEEHEESMMDWD